MITVILEFYMYLWMHIFFAYTNLLIWDVDHDKFLDSTYDERKKEGKKEGKREGEREGGRDERWEEMKEMRDGKTDTERRKTRRDFET